jgi:hypothetical protein
MSYESNLNCVSPLFTLAANTYTFSSVSSGLSATFFINISGTTLGNTLPDEDAKLIVQTSYAPANSPTSVLSASSPTSLYLSLSSATAIPVPVQYVANIISSTFNTSTSSTTLAINFPVSLDPDNVNMQTTTLYLSGNATTINLDPTKGTTLDNFFFVSTVPAENSSNKPNTVRTTSGHARLVAHLG